MKVFIGTCALNKNLEEKKLYQQKHINITRISLVSLSLLYTSSCVVSSPAVVVAMKFEMKTDCVRKRKVTQKKKMYVY